MLHTFIHNKSRRDIREGSEERNAASRAFLLSFVSKDHQVTDNRSRHRYLFRASRVNSEICLSDTKQPRERACPRTYMRRIPLARLRAPKQAKREICKSFESSTVTIAVSRPTSRGWREPKNPFFAVSCLPRCASWHSLTFHSCRCSEQRSSLFENE